MPTIQQVQKVLNEAERLAGDIDKASVVLNSIQNSVNPLEIKVYCSHEHWVSVNGMTKDVMIGWLHATIADLREKRQAVLAAAGITEDDRA